jgi:hypothetical protein
MVVQVAATFDGARVTHLGAECTNRFGESRIGLERVQGECTHFRTFFRQPDTLGDHQQIFFL